MKKSLISAIKKLLTKLGAEEIEGNNLVEVIDSGADAIEGGGGGGDVVNIAITVDTDNTVTTESTYTQLYEAITAGKKIHATITRKTAGGSRGMKHEISEYDHVIYDSSQGVLYFYIWSTISTGPHSSVPVLGSVSISSSGNSYTTYRLTVS